LVKCFETFVALNRPHYYTVKDDIAYLYYVTEKFFYNEFYIYKNLKKMRYILFFFTKISLIKMII